MDYIAQEDHHSRGIFYNSKRPVAGIHYHKENPANRESINIDLPLEAEMGVGPKSYSIDLNARNRYSKIQEHRIANLKYPPENFEAHQNLAKKQKKGGISYYKPVASKPLTSSTGQYLVSIAGQQVNFSAEGIREAQFSYSDELWLQKAQYYFLNVKEGGKKVGSAKDYTSLDSLKALWSAAHQVGADPKRFLVQIFNESRFNPSVTGRAGEKGIGQFKESTAKAEGYNWKKMKGGLATYAYQALCSAKFIKKVGEQKYNGAGWRSRKYVQRIDRRINDIDQIQVSALVSANKGA